MVRLHGGDDAELGEARNVGRIDDLCVFDAVARAVRYGRPAARNFVGILVLRREFGAGVIGLREGIESHGSGAVADGVEAKLEAGLGAFDGHGVEFGLVVARQAGVGWLVGVGRFHRGSARAERAIHEAL